MSKVYSKQSSKNNTKSYTESNMASKLIYDVKGKVGGVEKSY